MQKLISTGIAVLVATAASAGVAPTFQDLMDPAVFPDPQQGMAVESVETGDDAITVQTTGARMHVHSEDGTIQFDQRIGHERTVALLSVGQQMHGLGVTHRGPGFARITVEEPPMTIRINGDSLCMVQAHASVDVTVSSRIEPVWDGSFAANHLIADEWGAFGLYCSDQKIDDHFFAHREPMARYAPLPANAVLWVAVCPPKPYDWERSLKDNVVWHWSRETSYPTDDVLASWAPHGNIVLLQSEVMLWKDWNLGFEPRLGVEEFARVRKTIHDLGMRFIVYTSPFYFLKDTALESRALNSFENFKGWPPGTPTGENMDLFLEEIRKVMAEYKPDGLYFDGQYFHNPAALYALARHAREIVGEDGILEWHSTTALGTGYCYLPQADAYVDFILRGEGRATIYENESYMRFFVSGYNISNSIGVLCNNGPVGVNPDLARRVLDANGRFHTIVSWLDKPDVMAALDTEYKAKLTPDLRTSFEAQADARQEQAVEIARSRAGEIAALDAPPEWGDPVYVQQFDAMPDGEQMVSPANADSIAVKEGALRVKGHANTYAFVRLPIDGTSSGFVTRLKSGSDGGQSWGCAAALRFKNGTLIRIGMRAGGELQADVPGIQLHGSSCDVHQWMWLRARWLKNGGVVERSLDGVTYETLWYFEHGGVLSGPVSEVLVGKVPYDGEPKDHSALGGVGECAVDFVQVYAK
ncbi:MAG: hypothetical protein GY851_34265 [bacterium]|nr:hypothetical protein [bacterium]